jgi:hypothetical protein
LLADGNTAGPIFHINDQDEAAILDHTPMSVAYRFIPGARVLLLGETSGVNVWLARRFGASHITIVVENPQILELLRGPLANIAGHIFNGTIWNTQKNVSILSRWWVPNPWQQE